MKDHIVSFDEIYVTMNDIFTSYAKQVDRVTQETIDEVAKDGRQYIKDQTIAKYGSKNFVRYEPSRYQNCFRTQKIEDGRRIRNTRYQLSHLLEDGHIVANQYGRGYSIYDSEYGTSGKTTTNFKVWEKTEEKLNEELPDKMKKNLERIQ